MLWATPSSSPSFLPCLLAHCSWLSSTLWLPLLGSLPVAQVRGPGFSRLLCFPCSAYPTCVFTSGQLSPEP